MRPDVMVSHTTNGVDQPMGLVVPGMFSMAWVRDLKEIEICKEERKLTYNDQEYVYYDMQGKRLHPVTSMPINSRIMNVVNGESIPNGAVIEIGAWVGSITDETVLVAGVEVSLDGGVTWEDAHEVSKPEENMWSRGRHEVRATRGPIALATRARDNQGNFQPAQAEIEPNLKGYANNAWIVRQAEVI
jgi:sulfane dehydrogenase subunit SoxC